jgi:hypothetical protein
MGCDIHSYAERETTIGFFYIPDVGRFDGRSYLIFGFLAGVRNYSYLPQISEPRGFPEDASDFVKEEFNEWGIDAHTPSWLLIDELVNFNYDQETEDCRATINNDGGCTCEKGKGRKGTYREFLGPYYFEWINEIKNSGATRIVFWFDS